jgi:hypothetical protein
MYRMLPSLSMGQTAYMGGMRPPTSMNAGQWAMPQNLFSSGYENQAYMNQNADPRMMLGQLGMMMMQMSLMIMNMVMQRQPEQMYGYPGGAQNAMMQGGNGGCGCHAGHDPGIQTGPSIAGMRGRYPYPEVEGPGSWPRSGEVDNGPINMKALSPKAAQYQPLIEQISAKYGVDKKLVNAIIQNESGFNPNADSGEAVGLMQLTPGTARMLGVTNRRDPAQSIEGGVKYLSQLLKQFNGDVTKAVAAYNAGPNAVKKYGGIPPYPETRKYVGRVMNTYRNLA